MRLILWDWGGVIGGSLVKQLRRDYGLERTAFVRDAYNRCFLGEIPAYECIRRMTRGTPWAARWPEIYERTLTDYAVLNPGVWALIHRLKGAYRQGIVSNNSVEWGVHYTVRFGLRDLFDPVIFSATESLRTGRRLLKPEPEIFLHALGRVPPSQAVFIDDSRSNVQGARAVGLHAVHYTGLSSLFREFRKLKLRI